MKGKLKRNRKDDESCLSRQTTLVFGILGIAFVVSIALIAFLMSRYSKSIKI